MPKIEIKEKDLTTPGVVVQDTDIVFIPGFVDPDAAIEKGVPYLFTSSSEFKSLCGDVAPTFTRDQFYPKDEETGFGDNAIPSGENEVMFDMGTPDPGYVMAKELLAAGLSVLFMRVNGNSEVEDSYEKANTEDVKDLIGKTADENSTYYYKDSEKYVPYSTPITYPKFSDYKVGADSTVYELTAIDYVDVAKYYNDEAYKVDPTGTIDKYEEADYPTFKSVVLISSDGITYTVLSDAKDAPEKFGTDNESTYKDKHYALSVGVGSEPTDWKTNFNRYYVRSGKTVGGTDNDTYTKISLPSNYKAYESGNIYSKFSIDISSPSVKTMYTELENIFDASDVTGLVDKGNYDFKYLTTGGYPVFEYKNGSLVGQMLKLASTRGDCVALIDHTDNKGRTIDPADGDGKSLYQCLKASSITDGEFGAMFTPWSTFNRTTKDSNIKISSFRAPGSFAYLLSLADSIQTNANWLAVAGVARGGVRNLADGGMTTVIPNGVADYMQPRDGISINAVTNIRPYGYTIWGNRTLNKNSEGLVATSFLNIRNLISDVKKTCYRVARKMTFEQDTDVLWINFKSDISKLLDRMKSGYGISGYKILRDTEHEMAGAKATLCAQVVLFPVEPVEDFYITIVLKDDEVSVE